MAVVKLQKLLSNAKRCVFQFAKNDKILWKQQMNSPTLSHTVDENIKSVGKKMKYNMKCFRCYNSFSLSHRSDNSKEWISSSGLVTSKQNKFCLT
jgi:hypothetical protein